MVQCRYRCVCSSEDEPNNVFTSATVKLERASSKPRRTTPASLAVYVTTPSTVTPSPTGCAASSQPIGPAANTRGIEPTRNAQTTDTETRRQGDTETCTAGLRATSGTRRSGAPE